MDKHHTKLHKELDSLGTWYHNIDLGDDIRTNKENIGYDPETRWKLFNILFQQFLILQAHHQCVLF